MEFSHLDPDSFARALSLTGGGVRGIFTATVLSELEVRLCRNLSKQFDVFIGTSVGGIIAIGLACGISAQTVAACLSDCAPNIFGDPARLNPWGIRTTRYKNTELRECISRVLGYKTDIMIRDLNTNIVVPAVDAISNRVIYFSNVERIGRTQCLNARLIDVALATSAAPTYFPPHKIYNSYFLDGGIASNNPDIEALRFCSTVLSRPLRSALVLSIGTGNTLFTIDGSHNRGPSALKWLTRYKILDRIMSLQESKSSELVSDLLGDRYFRIDTTFEREIRLDDCREHTIQLLIRHAKGVVTEKWNSDASTLADFIR